MHRAQKASLGQRLEDEEERLTAARYIAERHLNVAQAEQYFFYGVIVFSYQTLENGRVFAVYRKNRGMVSLCQLAD